MYKDKSILFSVEFAAEAQGGRAVLEITGRAASAPACEDGNTELEPEVSFLHLSVDIKENY